MPSYNSLYIKIKKQKYIYLVTKVMKLKKKINKLKEENTYYKSLNKEKINNNMDDKINKHLEERLNNKNTLESDIDESKEIDICEDCGFEINENGCICPINCNNIDCENYDEDWDELCETCKNKLDEEVDELCEESNTLNDIEMEEEFYNENSSKTSKNRKNYNKLNENEENIKVINKLNKNYINITKNEKDHLIEDIKLNNRNTLKLFNDIYKKHMKKEIKDDYINNIYEIYDKNKSRFMKNLEISFKICSNDRLYNSNYVFPLYTFNRIKKSSIDNFINLLEKHVIENM